MAKKTEKVKYKIPAKEGGVIKAVNVFFSLPIKANNKSPITITHPVVPK